MKKLIAMLMTVLALMAVPAQAGEAKKNACAKKLMPALVDCLDLCDLEKDKTGVRLCKEDCHTEYIKRVVECANE